MTRGDTIFRLLCGFAGLFVVLKLTDSVNLSWLWLFAPPLVAVLLSLCVAWWVVCCEEKA